MWQKIKDSQPSLHSPGKIAQRLALQYTLRDAGRPKNENNQ